MTTSSVAPVLTRVVLAIAAIAALHLSVARPAAGQAAGRVEFRIPGGGFVPTGAQRRALDDARVSAAQLSWGLRPSLAIVGTFAWAATRDLSTAGAPKLDAFASDIGIESRTAEWCSQCTLSLRGFGGIGAGARSYNYRKLEVDATNNLAGYVSAGAELGAWRMRLRLEARDYASGFRPLMHGGRSVARNDVVILVGMRFNRRAR